MEPDAKKPGLTFAGKLVVFLFVAGLPVRRLCPFPSPAGGRSARGPELRSAAPATSDGNPIEIGIAYGTEKERWLQWAVGEFAKTGDERQIKIDLIPMGSLEGAQAVLRGDTRIHVWSPASSLYKDVFLQDWQVHHGSDKPIVREENLAALAHGRGDVGGAVRGVREEIRRDLVQNLVAGPRRERRVAVDRRQAGMGLVQAGSHAIPTNRTAASRRCC